MARWLKLTLVCPVCGNQHADGTSVTEFVSLVPGLEYPRPISIYAVVVLT